MAPTPRDRNRRPRAAGHLARRPRASWWSRGRCRSGAAEPWDRRFRTASRRLLDGADLVEKAPVVAELADEGDEPIEILAFDACPREAPRQASEHIALFRSNPCRQRLDASGIVLGFRFGKRLALLHHFHQELGISLGFCSLFDVDAVPAQERLGATNGVANQAPRFVDLDRLAERHPPLGRRCPYVLVGMQHAREIAVTLLDRIDVDLESRSDSQGVEWIEHGAQPLTPRISAP